MLSDTWHLLAFLSTSQCHFPSPGHIPASAALMPLQNLSNMSRWFNTCMWGFEGTLHLDYGHQLHSPVWILLAFTKCSLVCIDVALVETGLHQCILTPLCRPCGSTTHWCALQTTSPRAGSGIQQTSPKIHGLGKIGPWVAFAPWAEHLTHLW